MPLCRPVIKLQTVLAELQINLLSALYCSLRCDGLTVQLTGNRKCVFHAPGRLVLLGVQHRVLDGLVDQRVHVGGEGSDGLRQSFTALRQKLLSLCIQTKLHLTENKRERERAPTLIDTIMAARWSMRVACVGVHPRS